MYDLSGESGVRRLTLEGKNCCAIWSPDGQRVAFQSNREGDVAIFWQGADGSTPAERLTKPEKGSAHVPESWSPDGTTMLFTETRESTSSLWMLSMKDRTTTQFASVQSSATVSSDFSPDGRWVAYMVRGATLSSSQIFVQPFPNTGAKYLVADNASRPQWSPNGRELFFSRGNQVFGVSVTPQSSFTFGNPGPLPVFFALGPSRGATIVLGRETDVMPDGQRFIAVVQEFRTAGMPRIQVVLNLFEELKRRVPAN